jgi:16S rRNA (cytosine967-C5)-methyltransferase
MEDRGTIFACDTDRTRLQRLPPRAHRAGVTIADTRLLDGGREAAALADMAERADLVVIDAPCSGTGTWRRNPEARWRLTPARLAELVAVQHRLLGIAATLVKPGGAIAYIVCSLLDEEGPYNAAAFLAEYPGWTVDEIALPAGAARGPGLRLTPIEDATDGFFVARVRRPC